MWRPQKKARNTRPVGSASSYLYDCLDAGDDDGDGDFLLSSPERSRSLGRRPLLKSSLRFASRRQTMSTSTSPATLSSAESRRRHSIASFFAPKRYKESRIPVDRTRSDWNSVAQEIETVIFGESDEEEREQEGLSRDAIRNAPTNSTSSTSGNKSKNGVRFGRRRRKSAMLSTPLHVVPSTSMNPIAYNLFDDQEMIRPTTARSVGRTQQSPVVIYDQKYRNSPESLFSPIWTVLSATFVTLLVVRIATSLLTSGAGTLILILLAGAFVTEGVVRPIRLVRMLHSSPVLFWACFGAIFGSLHALWYQRFDPLLSWFQTKCQETTSSFECIWIGNLTSGIVDNASSISDDESTYNDFVMLWGLLRGVFYGVEAGSLWLITFGDRSNPSNLTKSFVWHIWRPMRRVYNRALIRRHGKRHFASSFSKPFLTAMEDDFILTERKDAKQHHRCAICLDCLDSRWEEDVGGDPKDRHVHESFQCQLLPCLHCFHEDSARHWLNIQHTCPVCRVPVLGMQSFR